MKRIDFNKGWKFRLQGEDKQKDITLPHDAQIGMERSKDAPGGSGHGYFPGGIYEYEKNFEVPQEWAGKFISLLFNGVYKDAEVYLNGTCIEKHYYGYTPFTVELKNLIIGKINQIKVIADNEKLPNARWYTGGGIYRPVTLLIGEDNHILWQGVKITTLSINPAKIRIESATSKEDGSILVQIKDTEGNLVTEQRGRDVEAEITSAHLWSAENPYLYECHVSLMENQTVCDEERISFGIRELKWSTDGFFVNGENTLLRGGCVHHDHGIIGARSFPESEERRIRILKEVGFNALRISHNPASTACIEACDKLGMYVMDETFDMWYNRKNPYDYGNNFEECWQSDTRAMVERDYNHPSVILYSIGNEVAEPAEQKGIEIGKEQIDFIHNIDSTRPVTCGVNLMVIGRAAKGNGIYQDGNQNISAAKEDKKKEASNGSLAFNIMATFIGSGMNKGGNSKKVDAISTPFVDSLDIAGYNYGSGRYPLEGTAHPNRIIFGSETFPQDICKNWNMVKKYPYLIGDFMWTAWDYLGEAGLGAWSYTGGMPFNRPYPWLLAGAGVIDILGNPDASCRYAATVWGLNRKPVIAVQPVNHPGVRVSKSVWRGTNAVESWSWRNCDGNKAVVEVYSDAASVELFINGKSFGKKRIKDCKAVYKTKYRKGKIEAVVYDVSGKEIARNYLESANEKVKVAVIPEKKTVKAEEICYINLEIQDEKGILESNDDRKLEVNVINGELLGFGSANPCTEENYCDGRFTTYLGRAQAIVRTGKSGKVVIRVSDEGMISEEHIEIV
ncbi:MAG: glycoside hydrolase family 2 protein [Clostridia bacterium]|nr:glycoside hydrolase family 2 protein [Clostridia bacterium]